MSYARFAEDSDVYLYPTIYGGDGEPEERLIECCGCQLIDWVKDPWPAFADVPSALAHLEAHKAAGHAVPEYAVTGIEADAGWLAGGEFG